MHKASGSHIWRLFFGFNNFLWQCTFCCPHWEQACCWGSSALRRGLQGSYWTHSQPARRRGVSHCDMAMVQTQDSNPGTSGILPVEDLCYTSPHGEISCCWHFSQRIVSATLIKSDKTKSQYIGSLFSFILFSFDQTFISVAETHEIFWLKFQQQRMLPGVKTQYISVCCVSLSCL